MTEQRDAYLRICVPLFVWYARHGRALTGESPEYALATRKHIAEQQGCLLRGRI